MSYTLERCQTVSRALDETFAFHAEPRNLVRLTPSWLRLRIVGPDDLPMRSGLRIHYRVYPLGLPQRWTSEITVWEPPHRFVDEQTDGPYATWHHLHEFRATDRGTEIYDRVTYALPYGRLGQLAHSLLVARQLRAIFDYRERAILEILGRPGGC